MLRAGFLRRYESVSSTPDIFISRWCIFCSFVVVYFKGSEVNYLTVEDVGEVLEIFADQDKDDKKVEEEEDEYVEDDEEEEYNGSSLIKK